VFTNRSVTLASIDVRWCLKCAFQTLPDVPFCTLNRLCLILLANLKYWYVDCKACGSRITLEIFTGVTVPSNRSTEILKCPTCLNECPYLGDDFKTAALTA
jgi:hypothetical protein